jgi:hypothetical protein
LLNTPAGVGWRAWRKENATGNKGATSWDTNRAFVKDCIKASRKANFKANSKKPKP